MRTTARALTEMFNDAWDNMHHGFDQVIIDEVMHAADKLATLSYEIGPSKTPDGIEIEDDPIIAWIFADGSRLVMMHAKQECANADCFYNNSLITYPAKIDVKKIRIAR